MSKRVARIFKFMLAVSLLWVTPCSYAAESDELEPLFKDCTGAFVMHDLKADKWVRYHADLCDQASSPCSTFKILVALAGLENGVIEDESTVLKWDGTKSQIAAWNKDHSLQSAMAESANWYFRKVMDEVGFNKMKSTVTACDYGNKNLSDGLFDAWRSSAGSLKITPNQQVNFLEKLERAQLPFSQRTREIVQKVMLVEGEPNDGLYGKTGTDSKDGKLISGWFVGFVKKAQNTYVFATRIEADGATGRKARGITESVLKKLNIL